MEKLSPAEKTALCVEVLGPFIDQFEAAWIKLEAKGVDYNSYLAAVFLLFATGVKNLSHHPDHVMLFLSMLSANIPGIQLAVLDRQDHEADLYD